MDTESKIRVLSECLSFAVNRLFQNQLIAEDDAKEILDALHNIGAYQSIEQ